MIKRAKLMTPIVIVLCLVVAGVASCVRRSSTGPASFDTSYSAPSDWKVVEDGMWGLRLKVPATLRDLGPKNDVWIHEAPNLRLVIDFGNTSLDSLRQRPHYSEARFVVNGLRALVCTYEYKNPGPGSLNKVVALFFLEKRKSLGGAEPSYRVEYAKDDDQAIALQILQTVHFFDS
jgi:hypothetical protein